MNIGLLQDVLVQRRSMQHDPVFQLVGDGERAFTVVLDDLETRLGLHLLDGLGDRFGVVAVNRKSVPACCLEPLRLVHRISQRDRAVD